MNVVFGILLLLIFFGFVAFYNGYLKENKGIDAIMWGRITLLAVSVVVAIATNGSNGTNYVTLIIAVITVVAVVILNINSSNSLIHGLLMTVYQLIMGTVIVITIFQFMDMGKRKKNKN